MFERDEGLALISFLNNLNKQLKTQSLYITISAVFLYF